MKQGKNRSHVTFLPAVAPDEEVDDEEPRKDEPGEPKRREKRGGLVPDGKSGDKGCKNSDGGC